MSVYEEYRNYVIWDREDAIMKDILKIFEENHIVPNVRDYLKELIEEYACAHTMYQEALNDPDF